MGKIIFNVNSLDFCRPHRLKLAMKTILIFEKEHFELQEKNNKRVVLMMNVFGENF
jgi:hypothetical protein